MLYYTIHAQTVSHSSWASTRFTLHLPTHDLPEIELIVVIIVARGMVRRMDGWMNRWNRSVGWVVWREAQDLSMSLKNTSASVCFWLSVLFCLSALVCLSLSLSRSPMVCYAVCVPLSEKLLSDLTGFNLSNTGGASSTETRTVDKQVWQGARASVSVTQMCVCGGAAASASSSWSCVYCR